MCPDVCGVLQLELKPAKASSARRDAVDTRNTIKGHIKMVVDGFPMSTNNDKPSLQSTRTTTGVKCQWTARYLEMLAKRRVKRPKPKKDTPRRRKKRIMTNMKILQRLCTLTGEHWTVVLKNPIFRFLGEECLEPSRVPSQWNT